jgi:hypothetical protein
VTTATLARIELAQSSPEWMTVRQIAKALGFPLAKLGAVLDATEQSAR